MYEFLAIIAALIAFFLVLAQRGRIETLENNVRMLRLELNELIKRTREQPKKEEEKKPEPKKEAAPTPTLVPPVTDIPPAHAQEKVVQPVTEKAPLETGPLQQKTILPLETPVERIPESQEERKPTPQELERAMWNNDPFEGVKKRTSAEWEALIGGKILNRIGALAIIIGVGFFLKYAFDNNWITESMRVGIGLLAGGLLLFGGHYFSKKDFAIFSQGLVGAGLAILYLSVYSSFNFYHLVSQQVAVGMMCGVTAITFWQGFKYNSITIALFGWLGGFLTPFLLSTGKANETGLFSYIAFLDLALLLIVLKKKEWFVIEPITLGATIFIFFLWMGGYYNPTQFTVTIIFLNIFWLMFLSLEVFRILRKDRPILNLHQGVSAINGVFYFGMTCFLVDQSHHRWLGLVVTGIAAVYLGVLILINLRRPEEAWLRLRYIVSVIFLVVIAAGIQFDDFELTIAWAVEAVALAAISVRYQTRMVLFFSLGVLILSALNFLGAPNYIFDVNPAYRVIISMRSAAILSTMAAAIGMYFLSFRVPHKMGKEISSGLIYVWVLCLFGFISMEVKDTLHKYFFSGNSALLHDYDSAKLLSALCVAWMALALPLCWFGLNRKIQALQVSSFILTMISVVGALVMSFENCDVFQLYYPLLNYRAIGLLFVAGGVALQLRWLKKLNAFQGEEVPQQVLQVMLTGLAFIFITMETRDLYHHLAKRPDGVVRDFFLNNLAFTFCVEWIALAATLVWVSLKKKIQPYFYLGISLTGICTILVLFNGLMTYEPIQIFYPFSNMRALAMALVAGCIFLQTQWIEKRPLIEQFKPVLNIMRVVMVIVVFVWLTADTKDVFEKKISMMTLTEGPAYAHLLNAYRNQQQLFISGVWLFYSMLIMVIGIYRRRLNVRIISIIIFGVTIFKVFLFDLSNLNTLYRIVSFIALGVILLLVSFLYQRYKSIIFAKE